MDSLNAVIAEAEDDSNKVKHMLKLSAYYFGSAPEEAIVVGQKAEKLARKIGYRKGVAYALKNIGIAYYYQGEYVESLGAWQRSLAVFDSINDRVGVANILNNIGAIYYNEGDYNNALDYYLKSLKVSEDIGDTTRIVTALTNIGAVYNDKPATHDKALEYSLRALDLSEKVGAKDAIATTSVNIGEIYLHRNDDKRALEYFEKSKKAMEGTDGTVYVMVSIGKVYNARGEFDKALDNINEALEIADQLNARPNKAHALVVKAETYRLMGRNDLAVETFKKSASLSREINNLKDLEEAYLGLNSLYSLAGQYDSAYKYQTRLIAVKDSLYDIEIDKLLSNQIFNFQIEKKQNEINLLRKEQEVKDLTIEREKLVRNLVGVGLISVVAFLLVVILQKKKISLERDRSEKLLLNILPYEIAEELKEYGKSEARDFNEVSVLFTDFEGFTGISQHLKAKELVEAINHYFKAFDEIITRYDIEKIKTIGDSYMAAGGLPIPDADAARKVVMAALEMQEVVLQDPNPESDHPNDTFKMRIGIHSGPVVAGIVGVKKFQYDIWGDTVNTASRIESSGMVGRVNISGATYEKIKHLAEFDFEYRGKVEAKGKGKLDMYFVRRSSGKPPKQDEHQPVETYQTSK